MSTCTTCLQPFQGPSCPFCLVRQVTGQALTTDSSSSSDSSAYLTASSSGVGQSVVQPASWEDFELLYPGLWIPYVTGKILDPSQERDSAARRNQLAGFAQQLNNVVKQCAALPAVDKQNWAIFAQQFIPWFDKTSANYNETIDKAQADLIQDQLRGWQKEIEKYCPTGMAPLPKATPTFQQLGEDFLTDVGKYFDTVKFLFVTGAAVLLISVAIIGVDNTRKLVMKGFG